MWLVEAHIPHTAHGTEHIDIIVIGVLWIEEYLSITTFFKFGQLTMHHHHFMLIYVIISIEIISYI